jgi:GT2 family glycosyltransferase
MLQINLVNRPAVKIEQTNHYLYLQPLVARLPLISCKVCVIIPVRNEAKNIEATLLALTNQVDLTGKPLNKNCYEIIVLANNCTDDSVEIVRHFARTNPDLILHLVEKTIHSDRAHVGWVRKLLMDEAYRRFQLIGRDLGVIASTDGDTRVAATWIAATLAEIEAGADAVGGRIITNNRERNKLDKSTRLYFLRFIRYGYLTSQLEAAIDPDFDSLTRHHHHYGASFAVTAQMYNRVGGLPPLPSSEDVALYDALMRVDARFRHSPAVRVVTSARALGRAKAGLADRLSELKIISKQQQCPLVESASTIEARFRLRRQLRHLWQRQTRADNSTKVAIVALNLGIEPDLLAEIIWRSPSFGLVIEEISQYQQENAAKYHESVPKVILSQAIADLQTSINQNLNCPDASLDALKQIEPISLLPQSC